KFSAQKLQKQRVSLSNAYVRRKSRLGRPQDSAERGVRLPSGSRKATPPREHRRPAPSAACQAGASPARLFVRRFRGSGGLSIDRVAQIPPEPSANWQTFATIRPPRQLARVPEEACEGRGGNPFFRPCPRGRVAQLSSLPLARPSERIIVPHLSAHLRIRGLRSSSDQPPRPQTSGFFSISSRQARKRFRKSTSVLAFERSAIKTRAPFFPFVEEGAQANK